MNKDLMSYVKVYKSAIPAQLCIDTVTELETKDWQKHTFYNAIDKKYYNNSNEPKFTYDGLGTTRDIMNIVWNQIEQYVVKDLNVPWWNSWQGFNIIKFNKYSKLEAMVDHCDHIHDMFDGERKGIPILTVIGLLNSNFKGGEFMILEDEIVDLAQGDILIFPSVFLYPHRVDPVITGTRYSFASWVW